MTEKKKIYRLGRGMVKENLHGKTNRQRKFYQKKKKKPTTIIKFSLAQEEEWSNEQFCGKKKKYKSAKANHKKPLSQEYKSSSLT
jgi:hypothetical protein